MRMLFSGLLLVLQAGCAVAPVNSNSSVVGAWELQDYGNGPFEFSHLGLTKDGRKCVVGYEMTPDGLEVSSYLNSYVVEDGVLVTTVERSNTTIPSGDIIRDRIDVLNDETMHLWMVQPPGRRMEKHQRLPDVDPERVCEYAEAILKIAMG